jgi:sortase A
LAHRFDAAQARTPSVGRIVSVGSEIRMVDATKADQTDAADPVDGDRIEIVGERGVEPRARRSSTISIPTVARRGALILGITVLAFVAFAFWFSALAHARSQVGLQRRFRAELAATSAPIEGDIAAGAPVAMLEISRLGLHEVVVEGTRSGQLQKGPGHLVGSPLPGQPGNAVIAGRHTLYGGPFRGLASMRPGDDLEITTGQGRATYRVTGVARMSAEGGSVLADHIDNRLTLFTADPAITASDRLVVTAALRGDPFAATVLRGGLDPEGLGLTGERGAIAIVLVWLELLVALVLLAVFALTRWSRLVTWLVFAPGIALLAWLLFENAVRLLPATL